MWNLVYSEKNKAKHFQRFVNAKDVDGRQLMSLEVTIHGEDVLYIGKVYSGSFLNAVDDPEFPNRVGYNFINGQIIGIKGRPKTRLSPHDHPAELTDKVMTYLVELVDTNPEIETNLTECIAELVRPGKEYAAKK